jgi:hypothetical protein
MPRHVSSKRRVHHGWAFYIGAWNVNGLHALQLDLTTYSIYKWSDVNSMVSMPPIQMKLPGANHHSNLNPLDLGPHNLIAIKMALMPGFNGTRLHTSARRLSHSSESSSWRWTAELPC